MTLQLPSSSPASSACSSWASSDSCHSYSTQDTQYSWPSISPDPKEPVGHQPALVKPVVNLPSVNTVVNGDLLRQHPRRTAPRDQPPPQLVRQHERKGQFVYHLVDSATSLVEVVWPTSAPACHARYPQSHQSVLPLRTFIEETLRRSKTSFSTLQVALFYLIMLKAHVPRYDFTMEQPESCPLTCALQCGRRMFLAALILGSKYLQDRNYSARAWSKISGLPVAEINLNERVFLRSVNWKLHIPEMNFNRWQDILIKYSNPSMVQSWKMLIQTLDPDCLTACPISPPLSPYPYSPGSKFGSNEDSSQFIASPISMDHPAWSRTTLPSVSVPPVWMQPRVSVQPPVAPMKLRLSIPSTCSTPAVGVASAGAPRAMCSAMNIAGCTNSRSSVDTFPLLRFNNTAPLRRISPRGPCNFDSMASSLYSNDSISSASTSSPRSSPGSMISDHLSSRSSSVSSISSMQTSPVRKNLLSRVATLNAAGKFQDINAAVIISSCDESLTVLGSTPLSLTSEKLTYSPEPIIEEEVLSIPFDPARESRKRHRSLVDSNERGCLGGVQLQDEVRNILRPALQYALPIRQKSLYEPLSHAAKKACRLPDEQLNRPTGPGMWQDVL